MTGEAARRANELYWESERSVNQIAEALDLSKSALYEMIRPLPAPFACPRCRSRLIWENRTAKAKEEVACPSCSWSGLEAEGIDAEGIDAEGPEVVRSEGGSGGPRSGSRDPLEDELLRDALFEGEFGVGDPLGVGGFYDGALDDELLDEALLQEAGSYEMLLGREGLEAGSGAGMGSRPSGAARRGAPLGARGILAGGALLGVAAGVALVLWSRRR